MVSLLRSIVVVTTVLLTSQVSAFVGSSCKHEKIARSCRSKNDHDHEFVDDDGMTLDANRRSLWTRKLIQVAVGLCSSNTLVPSKPSLAAWSKSRVDGYSVQKSESEWKSILSSTQYEILRQGGTERPGFSVLETEKRPGTFKCAGCGTSLFDSKDKFNSGTGWPSFARGLAGVEVEPINPLLASVTGAELRCATCGGHLGDVFQDGFLFVGTEAAKTGQRYCIDGAALVFYPAVGGDPLSGDIAKKKEVPSWLEPPKISPQ